MGGHWDADSEQLNRFIPSHGIFEVPAIFNQELLAEFDPAPLREGE